MVFNGIGNGVKRKFFAPSWVFYEHSLIFVHKHAVGVAEIFIVRVYLIFIYKVKVLKDATGCDIYIRPDLYMLGDHEPPKSPKSATSSPSVPLPLKTSVLSAEV